jgi:hypothetical protein
LNESNYIILHNIDTNLLKNIQIYANYNTFNILTLESGTSFANTGYFGIILAIYAFNNNSGTYFHSIALISGINDWYLNYQFPNKKTIEFSSFQI